MIRHDYAAKHDLANRRPHWFIRACKFMVTRDHLTNESPLEVIAAGVLSFALIGVLIVLFVMIRAGAL